MGSAVAEPQKSDRISYDGPKSLLPNACKVPVDWKLPGEFNIWT